jgi:spermidine/putrescine transport system substrate-binding protein
MLTRRSLFGAATAAGLGAAALAVGIGAFSLDAQAASKEIRVLNWQGYGTDEAWALKMFEAKTGYKVVHDYFTSEQEMLTKLRTAPGTYDVVLMNSTYVPQAIKEGLVQPIDPAKITNFNDLTPALRDSPLFVSDGKHWAVSWVWGMTAMSANKDKVTPKPDSVEALWDPAHAGKVSIRDDSWEAVHWAALATGQDMSDPADLAKVKEKLMALKPQIRMLWTSEDDWNKAMQANQFDVATYWVSAVWRAQRKFNLPVELIIPKEGVIGWFDGLTVAKDAPNPDAAQQFIDFMVSPEFYVKWETDVGAPISANAAADAKLPASDPSRELVADKEAMARVHFVHPISDERKKVFQEMWDEVKAYYAK